LIKKNNLSIDDIEGTGPEGRIVESDVFKAV
jgi:pyruvate/2-oxoglutarate dehydrogenase complex dihydrolipoamide acyltransferase (E2) component